MRVEWSGISQMTRYQKPPKVINMEKKERRFVYMLVCVSHRILKGRKVGN